MIRSARLPLAGLVALALLLLIAGNASALIMFSSPSRNIGCAMDRGFARCDVAKKRWHAPPKPKRCMLDWGNGLLVGRRGRAQFVCAGDTSSTRATASCPTADRARSAPSPAPAARRG